MSPETAVYILWFAWYASWIAAAAWSGRATVRMKTDRLGWHRLIAGLGCGLLFSPTQLLQWQLRPLHGAWMAGRLWAEPPWAAWGLFALTAAGFGFCWWARLHLGRLWSGFVTLKADHRIVDTGPYRLVRHPIYSGVIFAALSTALMRESVASLAGFALIAAGFSMTARIEEGFLRKQLGPRAYDDYSRRTPMLVPWTR